MYGRRDVTDVVDIDNKHF